MPITDEHLTDEELILRHRRGEDTAALDELFRRQFPKVALWCLRLSGNRDAAAEMAQEVIVRAYENLGSFRMECKFSTWLYSIARHHSFNCVRRQQTRPEASLETLATELAQSPGPDPHTQTEDRLNRAALEEMIASELDETEQKVVRLHYFEELPLPAVTRLLQLENPSGAKAHVVSARRKLQRAAMRKNAKLAPPGAGD